MTLGEYLYAALQPLVAGRCYPAGTADSTALPRITYSVVGGTPINYVEDTLADHELPRVQLSVWTATFIAAEQLMRQVEAAMHTAPQFAARRVGGPLTVFEEDTRIHGRHQDFNVLHAR